jgi:hypothetical protein
LRSTAEARRPQRKSALGCGHTHLVLCVGLGQLDRLLEDAIVVLEADRLLPVVKGAGDENLIRSVFPNGVLVHVEPTTQQM